MSGQKPRAWCMACYVRCTCPVYGWPSSHWKHLKHNKISSKCVVGLFKHSLSLTFLYAMQLGLFLFCHMLQSFRPCCAPFGSCASEAWVVLPTQHSQHVQICSSCHGLSLPRGGCGDCQQ